MAESFSPMDILFYGIAVYEGFKFAFRRITEDTIQEIKLNNSGCHPSQYKLRLPLAVGSFVLLSLCFFMLKRGYSGVKTYYYESGAKMSEGKLQSNKEHGLWNYFYENGQKRSDGYYADGIADSLWHWYDENGTLFRSGHYKTDLEHGVWITYYSNGIVSDSGAYYEGRMTGQWVAYHENGQLSQEGSFLRNFKEGLWNSYYENGQKSTEGQMKAGEPIGDWINYYQDGQISDELTYNPEGELIINNAWDINGEQIVKDGSGIYRTYSEKKNLLASGEIKNGIRTGIWKTYYENGNLKEEGKYEGQIYLVVNSWTPQGERQVRDGKGTYTGYFPDGIVIMETGEINYGYRQGNWKVYYESTGTVSQELIYENGLLNGEQKFYNETGELYAAGGMVNDLREGEWNWYYANGIVSSTVFFEEDKKEGKQTMFSEVGVPVKEEYYKDGELIEEKMLL